MDFMAPKMGENESKVLLSMIIHRDGSAYTSTWMEKYKSFVHKKSLLSWDPHQLLRITFTDLLHS